MGDPLQRVTLTAPVISQAACIAVLVAGVGKAAMLREVLEGTADPLRLPALLIRPEQGKLLWLVDRDAASLLQLPAQTAD
jgi:6-phosphogluconolactonase